MEEKAPIYLGHRTYVIDGFDLGMPGRTGIYVIDDKDLTLVETGPSPSVPYIKKGLEDLGFKLTDVKNIILTHIHLDHAGGSGLLLQECPQATVYVHPKGKRHLINPSKLIAGAKQVYGDQFEPLFAPILPIPEDRIQIVNEQDELQIGPSATLTFYHTPGHANHHISIYDSESQGLFTGDACGIRYQHTEEHNVSLYLPSTSPNQFDPFVMLETIKKLSLLPITRIYFGHFSMSDQPNEVFKSVAKWLPIFMEAGHESAREGEDLTQLKKRLHEKVAVYLDSKGVPRDHAIYNVLELDFEVSAMGIADYLEKTQALPTN
ncbi:MBL fold metallo-hydrolase [Pontibacillus salipaludis]|uniref:MBL fold metallo-hydrolase n=1 Tax=Pontibacillus salipaludis TaxID=1697394 RepID=UPI0031E77118